MNKQKWLSPTNGNWIKGRWEGISNHHPRNSNLRKVNVPSLLLSNILHPSPFTYLIILRWRSFYHKFLCIYMQTNKPSLLWLKIYCLLHGLLTLLQTFIYTGESHFTGQASFKWTFEEGGNYNSNKNEFSVNHKDCFGKWIVSLQEELYY